MQEQMQFYPTQLNCGYVLSKFLNIQCGITSSYSYNTCYQFCIGFQIIELHSSMDLSTVVC